MTRALFSVWMLSVISLCGGCHVCKGLHQKIQSRNGHACHEGCGPGCSDGACGCPTGHCDEGPDGHPDFYEPLHMGHQGPPERGGVLAWLGRDQPPGVTPIPEQAQPAPGPSAAGVSYPYYTNRGPRDFLASDPRGIGPNY
jgi:hypothetical protein